MPRPVTVREPGNPARTTSANETVQVIDRDDPASGEVTADDDVEALAGDASICEY